MRADQAATLVHALRAPHAPFPGGQRQLAEGLSESVKGKVKKERSRAVKGVDSRQGGLGGEAPQIKGSWKKPWALALASPLRLDYGALPGPMAFLRAFPQGPDILRAPAGEPPSG